MTNVTPGSKLTADAEGVVSVQAFALPLSAALSPAAANAQKAALQQDLVMPDLNAITDPAQFRAMIDNIRLGLDEALLKPLLARMAQDFPVQMEGRVLNGVNVEEFTPLTGVDGARVLINLHGGGFFSGAVLGGRVESIPLAHLGKFRIISVDYRQAYEHRYPAASEDVEAVYRALLSHYPAERIGIYGGSAGGTLSAQATAWIIDKGLPPPGAIGILSSGTGGPGDSTYFSAIGTGRQPPFDALSNLRSTKHGYFAGTSPDDILIHPNLAPPEFRAKFPPSLFVTGTRAFEMSSALATHRAFCQAGVETELHVFDGLGHCFYYDAWLPESADVNQTLIRFFRKHLK